MGEQSNEDVMVSVIMTTYNQQKYIQQALESVLMQRTSFLYEIWIGDDASTDETADIVRHYEKQYPNVVHAICREENIGPTKNAYDMLCRAQGKYIAYCEGDDYWIDNAKLQKQVDFLKKNPNYYACTHDCQIVNVYGETLAEQKLNWVSPKRIFTRKDFNGINLPGQTSTWVHKNFLNDTAHNFSIICQANPYVGDRTTVMILLMYGPIYHMPTVMSCYRKANLHTETNITTIAFKHNENVNQMQYEMTCTLEKYAREEFGVPLHFTIFKVSQWIKMILHKVFRSKNIRQR